MIECYYSCWHDLFLLRTQQHLQESYNLLRPNNFFPNATHDLRMIVISTFFNNKMKRLPLMRYTTACGSCGIRPIVAHAVIICAHRMIGKRSARHSPTSFQQKTDTRQCLRRIITSSTNKIVEDMM